MLVTVRDRLDWVVASFDEDDLGYHLYKRVTVISVPAGQDAPEPFSVGDDFAFPAKLLRLVDGDTWDLETLHNRTLDMLRKTTECSTYLVVELVMRVRHRLRGVNTPEVYGVRKGSDEYNRGKAASAFAQQWCDDAVTLTAVTYKGRTGKYGRYLTELVREDAPVSLLGEALVEAGHGARVTY